MALAAKSTAQGQVTLEHVPWSKIASHSQNQQMGVQNSKRITVIDSRCWPITSNGDFDQSGADLDAPAQSRKHARLKSTQKQQTGMQKHLAHTSRSGDLLLHR